METQRPDMRDIPVAPSRPRATRCQLVLAILFLIGVSAGGWLLFAWLIV